MERVPSTAFLTIISLFAVLSMGVAQLPITFTTSLTGEQAVPPATTEATGTAIAVLVNDLVVVTGSYQGLSSTLQPFGLGVLIHEAPVGETGQTVRLNREAQGDPPVTLEPSMRLSHDGGIAGTFKGAFRLTEEQVQALQNGQYYLAVHTQLHPAGELRGQLEADHKLDASTADLIGLWVRGKEERLAGVAGEEQLLLLSEDGTFRTEDIVGTLEASLARLHSRFVDDSGPFEFDGAILTMTSGEVSRCQIGSRWVHLVRVSRDGQTFKSFNLEDDCQAVDPTWKAWERIPAE